ncbi:OmpW family outer membrane protein [Rickettsia endosymbiont of Oedothorax gibbosus]|uniref:OmpW family outer membrane protein n=1 Tax=Rickettsia endosymbiont of Oedothorax gibbosus TaxID=931099 RepID=UPI0020246F00|nr:OmpW family outer membrane protein [Rickettsia endosymbiont of Oedothorax gibbosus]
MIKVTKKLGVFLLMSCVSISSFANHDSADNDYGADYNANYYENDGGLLFRMRAIGIKSSAKQTDFPNATVKDPVSIGTFAENGYGIEASTSVFFANYVAAELSLGFDVLRNKNSNLKNVAYNYGTNPEEVAKRRALYMIPLTVTGQYHIAPFGAIRPYIGVGYHGAYFVNSSKGCTVRNGHGAVLQLGVDLYAKDDTLINLDIKQYFLNTTVEYKSPLVRKPISSKVKFNPLMIAIGVGFRF